MNVSMGDEGDNSMASTYNHIDPNTFTHHYGGKPVWDGMVVSDRGQSAPLRVMDNTMYT